MDRDPRAPVRRPAPRGRRAHRDRPPVVRRAVVLAVAVASIPGGAALALHLSGPGEGGSTARAVHPPRRPAPRPAGAAGAAGAAVPVTASLPRAVLDGRPVERFAVGVLRGWDQHRATAYTDGRPAELRHLYGHDSAAGRADVRMLRRYTARGLRVCRLRMQLLAVRVLSHRPRLLRLLVVDRLAQAAVRPAGGSGCLHRLPDDRPSRRVLVLRRHRGVWRVATVRHAG